MSGGIDQIELILLPVRRAIQHPHRMRFDGDAAFALQVHAVEQLLLEVAFVDGMGIFQKPVGQRRFAMVDVGDNRKIPDMLQEKTLPYRCFRNL
ncbi:hypothetical protein SDC9_149103 [bioreactor metagenome]|uniref:Uncharacterized protein n=1 Tax=bioreactor metagenome TaxID=1076179 RepID=A0A645EKP5_9ZZZZ